MIKKLSDKHLLNKIRKKYRSDITTFILMILRKIMDTLLITCCIASCKEERTGFAISKDSTPIYYKTFGSGPPLLIINGGPGMNSAGFEDLAKRLSRNHTTIIYDQRGTGRSALNKLDSSTITIALMMEDIEAIRKKLNLQKWSILGHSFGGMMASYYACMYPQYLDKMILSSSGGIDLDLLNYVSEQINAKLSKPDQDSVAYWTKKIEEGDTTHFAKYERGRHLAPAYVVNKKFISVIAERLTQSNAAVNQLIWEELIKIKFNCYDKLKTFHKPVLIIQGRQDIIRPETAEKAHAALSNSRIVYLDHSIHYGWLDNGTVFFKEINTFLKE